MDTSIEMMAAMLPYIPLHGKLLDPSCGTGGLMKYVINHVGNEIDGVELNDSKWRAAMDAPELRKSKIIHGDFMLGRVEQALRGRHYDCIIAVPPHKDGVDCDHIKRMYQIVEPRGVVISYTLPIWTTGTFGFQRSFRTWLNDLNYQIKFIEDESYASCPKALLVIRK